MVSLYSGWIVGYGIQKVHILTPNLQNRIQKWHAPRALTSLQSSSKLSKARKFGRRCRPMWYAGAPCGILLYPAWKSKIADFALLRKSSSQFPLFLCFLHIRFYNVIHSKIEPPIMAVPTFLLRCHAIIFLHWAHASSLLPLPYVPRSTVRICDR